VALQHAGAWLNRNIVDGNVKFDIGQAPVPKGPGGRSVPIAQNSWYFGGHTKYPDQVWSLNSYLIGPHGQDLIVPLGQRNPTDKRIKLTLQFPFENADVYNAASQMALPFPRIKPEAEFEKQFQTAMDAVILGQKSVPQAMADLTQQTNDLIKGG
jgi:ABC-type glycerol-3-phosphate transport system substrate-binding protein